MRDGTQIGTYANGQLPNITGQLQNAGWIITQGPNEWIGCVGSGPNQGVHYGSNNGTGVSTFYIDASRSSSVYNNDEFGVVPRHLTMNFIIKY